MKFGLFLPLLCAIPAFILSMLCLYAGSSKGFMEDYHIVVLNTSTLGQIMVDNNSSSATTTSSSSTATSTTSSATSTHSGILDGWLPGVVSNVTGSIQDDLDSIEDDLADKLAQMLGIDQWYSMHLMDMCYGSYSPNSTASSTSLNISGCTSATPMYHFDPSDMIDSQLAVGSYNLNLSSVGWNQSMSDNIAELYEATDAVYALFCLGASFSALSILTCIAGIVKSDSKPIINLNWVVTLIAALALFLSAALTTVVTKKTVDKINSDGEDIGVFASKGTKFLSLCWAAAALMIAATITWFIDCYLFTRRRRTEYEEKKLQGEAIRLSEVSYDQRPGEQHYSPRPGQMDYDPRAPQMNYDPRSPHMDYDPRAAQMNYGERPGAAM